MHINTTKLISLLALFLAACETEETEMGVEWTPVAWPLTGGIQTKKSPLAIAPGSHVTLQNVRQERDNEWKPRNGCTLNTNDNLPSFPMKEIGLPNGGRIAMTVESGNSPSGLLYQATAPGVRWKRMSSSQCSQSTPAVWSRRGVAPTDTAVQTDSCEGSVYSLTAWAGIAGSSLGLFFRIASKADGVELPASAQWPANFIVSTGVRPRCIVANDTLWLVYIDTAANRVVAQGWSGATGAPTVVTAVQPPATNPIHFMDAFSYAAGTVTVITRAAAGAGLRFIEFNSTTGANLVNTLVAGDADIGLSLLPDPDLSGIRMAVAVGTTFGTVVLRYNAAGAVVTNETASAFFPPVVTGSAYQAGVGWQIVCAGGGGPGAVWAVKKFSGVIGAPASLIGFGPYDLNSVAWRSSSWDMMHYILGIHGSVTDPQDSYFEMALPYNTGSSVVVNSFPEPQARLIPLQAGPASNAVYPGHLSHMMPDGTGGFVGSLLRLARFGQAAGAQVNQYVIDRWAVSYLSQFSAPTTNQGQGTTTDADAFIPSGSLLMSGGGQLVAHGLASVPIQPALTIGAGGFPAGQYSYVVVVEVLDENGNVWRSPPSTPAIATFAVPSGITLAVTISGTELASRIVTVKIYRTKNNGSVYQLANARTGTASGLQHFTFADGVADTALGDFLSAEVPATITPAFTHTAVFGNRMWGFERDFTNLWLSKPLQKGFQPEFPGVTPFLVPMADEEGTATALYALDDKIMVHKPSAVYSVAGDGPDNGGGGAAPTVTRLDSDVGSIAGSPVITTGAEAYFVSARGIQRIDRSAQISFIGADVDRYLNQPSLASPLTITGGVFSPTKNEVRFLGQSSFGATITVLVFDRLRNIWYTDNGVNGGVSDFWTMSRMTASGEVRYTSTGTMTFESYTATDDIGTAIVPIIGSAWIQGAGPQGRFRLRRARVLGATTGALGGSITPVLSVLWNFDESGTIQPVSESSSPSTPIADSTGVVRAEFAPRNQKCTAFRLQLQLPNSNTTFRLEQWAAVVGIKNGPQKLTTAERWV